MNLARIIVTCLLAFAAAPTPAADAPFQGSPPAVLQAFVEELVPGTDARHEAVERAWATLARDYRLPDPILDLTPVFGPKQCWVLNGFGSLAALQEAADRIASNLRMRDDAANLKLRDKDLITAERVLALVLRPELGRKLAVPFSRARYHMVHQVQVRPGHEADFEKEMRSLAAAYEKAGSQQPWVVYQLLAGRPGPFYLVLMPLAGLADLDALVGSMGGVVAALGEEGMKAAMKAAEGYASVESLVLEVRPRMSYVPEAWTKEAPDLWKGALVLREEYRAAGPR